MHLDIEVLQIPVILLSLTALFLVDRLAPRPVHLIKLGCILGLLLRLRLLLALNLLSLLGHQAIKLLLSCHLLLLIGLRVSHLLLLSLLLSLSEGLLLLLVLKLLLLAALSVAHF
jgi:hypothetical protein